jgi:hypothetical protein
MNPISRITGHVTHRDQRSGMSKAGSRYSITEITVLVMQRVTVLVTLPDEMFAPSIGDEVDYLVEVTAFRDTPRFRVLEPFPADATV